MPRISQESQRMRVPTTLVRIVSRGCVSHQSTLGRPVTPAALSTWLGLNRSNSASTADLFCRRQLAYSQMAPSSLSSCPNRPPIQPVRPNTRNLGFPSAGTTAGATTSGGGIDWETGGLLRFTIGLLPLATYCLKTFSTKDVLIGFRSGNSFSSLVQSNSLLDRGAASMRACSSREKFFQVYEGSTYCLYNASTSLWLIVPGFVKL
mmetsp:Transcript_35567/g.49379  ORF Transcript_35567/g.49379 Transcript_35567/m.49379 type:complete len:206 (-) Transcript_35567:1823-2440(-)